MATLSIESSNPLFSHALRKNPAAGMLIKGYRKGHLFGWYSDGAHGEAQRFNVLFKDSDTEVSFGEDDRDFEYLDTQRFDTPYIVLAAVGEFMNHLSSANPPEEDTVARQRLTLHFVDVHREVYLEKFRDFFPEVSLSWTAHGAAGSGHGYTVVVECENTLAYLTDYAQLLALFLVLTKKGEFLYFQDSLIEKYVGIIERLRAPYYIASLFKTHFMSKSRKFFGQFKEKLEAACAASGQTVELAFGGSHQARIDTITDALQFTGNILDVGCGEGRYLHLAKKLSGGVYVAYDPDPEAIDKASNLAIRKKWMGPSAGDPLPFHFANDLDRAIAPANGIADGHTEVILTEVVEHMPKDEAKALIGKLLTGIPNLQRIVLTVPNKDFNQFWDFEDDQMRHDDHDWEPTRDEFMAFVQDAVGSSEHEGRIVSTFSGCGDVVEGYPLSLICVIEPQPVEALEEEPVEA